MNDVPHIVPYATVETAYWKRFSEYKKLHNQSQTQGLGVRLRKNVMPVFSAISRKYLLMFHRCSKMKLWNEQKGIDCEVPMLTISRRELAVLCECHENTITNNLHLLTATGAIYLQKNDHGQSYTLCPNHWILLGSHLVEAPEIQALEAPPTGHTFKKDAQIFTNINNLKILNKNNNAANEPIVEKRNKAAEPKKQAIEENKREKKEKVFGERWNVFEGGGELSTPRGGQNSPKPPHTPPQITEAEKMSFVNKFWDYAKEKLYEQSAWVFYEAYEQKVKQVIYSDVFGFQQVRHQPESNTYLHWLCRSGELTCLVDKMVHHNEKTGRLPYAALQYFSRAYGNEAKQGFLVVQQWAKKEEEWRRQADKDKLLQQAKDAMIRYRLPRGKTQIANPQQLYDWHIRKLAQKADAQTVEAFQYFVSTHKLY